MCVAIPAVAALPSPWPAHAPRQQHWPSLQPWRLHLWPRPQREAKSVAQRHSLELQESLQAQRQLEKELADAQVACVRANMHKLPRQTAAIHALPCEGGRLLLLPRLHASQRSVAYCWRLQFVQYRARSCWWQDQQRQEMKRRTEEADRVKAELGEIDTMVAGLAEEKRQMEETVQELMLRLQAATKHTQALADERTFLQVRPLAATVAAATTASHG